MTTKITVDASKAIKDYDGVVLSDELGILTIQRLLRLYTGNLYVPDPQDPTGAEKSVIADAMAIKIHSAYDGVVELTQEEYDLLKIIIKTPRHGGMVYRQIKDSVYGATIVDLKR